MAHIRWAEAYQFFISNESITYRHVSEKFHINYDYVKEVGARDKWTAKRDQVYKTALNLVDERTKEHLLERTQSHITFGKALQLGAAKKLAEGKLPTTAHDILTWIQVGVNIERQALGMNQKIYDKTYVNTPQVKFHITYGDGAELDEY